MSNATSLPLTYTDLVCLDDMDPLASETTSDLENMWQDAYHILIEDPGSNPDDIDRGLGISSLLSGDASVLQTLPRLAEQELLKDERIDQVRVQLAQVSPGGTYSDGSAAPPEGAYEVLVQIQPAGSVLPTARSFAYSPSAGFVPL